MTDKMPTNANSQGVYKTQDFESYAMWKAMPSILRGQPRQVLERFGIDDEIAVDLLEIKTQKEFAKKFNIKDPATLTDWNKKIEKEGLIPGINAWARKLTPNVLLALYKAISKDGKASEVRVWYELVEGM
jgi:hypothetical protein